MRRAVLPAAALLATGAAPPPPAPIDVLVTGMQNASGRIVVAICPEAQFLKSCQWSGQAPAATGPVSITVHGVPPGRYAVQAFQDENGNGVLDTYWFGVPKEPIGFSNDALRRVGKPRFDKAAIVHGTTPQRVAVTIRSLIG